MFHPTREDIEEFKVDITNFFRSRNSISFDRFCKPLEIARRRGFPGRIVTLDELNTRRIRIRKILENSAREFLLTTRFNLEAGKILRENARMEMKTGCPSIGEQSSRSKEEAQPTLSRPIDARGEYTRAKMYLA